MVDPDRNPLSGLVEIDETAISHQTKEDPVAGGQGRSHQGKLLIIGATVAASAAAPAMPLSDPSSQSPRG
jgi:hypothetical protein